MFTQPPKRILVVNPFGIGDVLFSTPVIQTLRHAFPESYIGYLCNRRTEQVLRHNPHVNMLFVYEKDKAVQLWRRSRWQGARYIVSLLRQIQAQHFDLVFDLSLGERYSFLLRLLGSRRIVGFNYRSRGRFLTESLPIDGYHDQHVVAYYAQLLQYLGVRPHEANLELHTAAVDQTWAKARLAQQGLQDHPILIGIVPGGGVSWGVGAPFRRWYPADFAAVANALVKQHGAQIVLFGEAADMTTCRQVAQAMCQPPWDLSGQTTLGQFVSLLGQLRLVICNDGGPLHLAVSQRVPTISLFGPVDPRVYGPYPPTDARHRVIYRQELRCRPCYHQFRLPPCPYERACLTTIEAGEVIQACAELLAG